MGAPCMCSMPAPNLEEWTTFIKLMEMKVLEAQKKQQDLQQELLQEELLEGCDVEEFDSNGFKVKQNGNPWSVEKYIPSFIKQCFSF